VCEQGFVLYAPNVFSPNGDGQNDWFELVGPDLQVLDMQVFDRWGGLVFRSQKPATTLGWDGRTHHAATAAVGTYVWVAQVQQGARTGYVRGDVLLLR
jgi:gliding motility-associated-like protein